MNCTYQHDHLFQNQRIKPMTLTVQELIAKLDQFQDGATVQVEDDGVNLHIDEVKKDENRNAILVIKSKDDEDDEDDE
ncbi:hypothetical protein [Anabaena catenula]|uniref:Uncharacterized protein n=1 Tax=Anabaena catenula FACHB-362 TaxID=2692877 RepID=A0ABR8J2Q1_9NOST|nr:hypothetical protein [Anabaena catenula]MBD2692646.1 hypothetical protein [Anabaena catenula FACHB-362]